MTHPTQAAGALRPQTLPPIPRLQVAGLCHLADVIEAEALRFRLDMSTLWTAEGDGWAADLAAQTLYLFHDRAPDAPECMAAFLAALPSPAVAAATLLGLTARQRDALFYPPDWRRPGLYGPAQAAAVLRHLAATGRVDWSFAP